MKTIEFAAREFNVRAEGNIRKPSPVLRHLRDSEWNNSREIASRIRLACRCRVRGDYHISLRHGEINNRQETFGGRRRSAAFPARCRRRTCSASLNYSAAGEENVLIVPRNKRTHVRVRAFRSRDSHVLHAHRSRHARVHARLSTPVCI